MTNVAGHCDECENSYNHVAIETLGDYLSATAYHGETVRAFIEGFEAALFTFKVAGLSQPSSCVGTEVQQ